MKEAFTTVFKPYALYKSCRRFLMRYPATFKAGCCIPCLPAGTAAKHTAGMTEYENIGSGRSNVMAVFGL